MCKAGNNERPTVCEVEGCSNTTRIWYHRESGLYVCEACRAAWYRRGTFARKRVERLRKLPEPPHVCQVSGCDGTYRIMWQKETGLWVCNAHHKAYRRTGTYARKYVQRGHRTPPSVCEVCKERPPVFYGCKKDKRAGKMRWRCNRCWMWYQDHQRERPRHLNADVCHNPACRRPSKRSVNGRYCSLCRTHKVRFGIYPSAEHIAKYAPHGWCECGKPATKEIDLRTGYLYVNHKKEEFRDGAEWVEWMCDECAGLEAEMQDIDTSDYRPTGYFNSREAGR